MDKQREKFEALPEIADSLQDGEVYWDEKESCYIATDVEFYYDAGYANGAYYAFQEKQNKIDSIKEKLTAIYDACDDNTTVAILLDGIQELLE